MCIKSWPSDLSETGYIGFDHHRIICVIDHKAGFLARGFPYLLALYMYVLSGSSRPPVFTMTWEPVTPFA